MAHVEFTIEPFVEGAPGPHVTAAIDAVRDRGVEVDIGPFGTACTIGLEDVGALVGSFTDAAFANGATHVTVQVSVDDPWASSATPVIDRVVE
ncbi:MAG: thiamine-binding protein [Ilumatobacteraceae bacterium]